MLSTGNEVPDKPREILLNKVILNSNFKILKCINNSVQIFPQVILSSFKITFCDNYFYNTAC